MNSVSWWGKASSIAAPIVLIAGFTISASNQQAAYDPWVDTISALAAPTATDPWIMTTALYALGLCHIITALALRPAAPLGRLILAFGGIATVGVAMFPTNASSTPTSHMLAAGLAFGALTVWPVVARNRFNTDVPLLRARVCWAATTVIGALLLWFVLELARAGSHVGLAERVVAVSQALWPLLVTNSLRTYS